MATYYWYGGAGNIYTTASNWSTTPPSAGFTQSTVVPTSNDDIVFSGEWSNPCLISPLLGPCKTATFRGQNGNSDYTSTLTINHRFEIYGTSVIFSPAMTVSLTSSNYMRARTANTTIYTNGLNGVLPLIGMGTPVTITNSPGVTGVARVANVYNQAYNVTYNININCEFHSCLMTSNINLAAGVELKTYGWMNRPTTSCIVNGAANSTLTIDSSIPKAVYISSGPNSLTLHPTSVIPNLKITNIINNPLLVGHEFNTVPVTGAAFPIQNLIIRPNTPNLAIKFWDTTWNINGTVDILGNATNKVILDSYAGSASRFTFNKTSGTVECDYVNVSNSIATGITFYAGPESHSLLTNTSGWSYGPTGTNNALFFGAEI